MKKIQGGLFITLILLLMTGCGNETSYFFMTEGVETRDAFRVFDKCEELGEAFRLFSEKSEEADEVVIQSLSGEVILSWSRENQEPEDAPLPSPDESAEPEDTDLFNFLGVAFEMLAEGEELTKEAHAEFIGRYGFEETEPFYQYIDTEGNLLVELYYDEERETGCGFRYGENIDGPLVCGFAFSECGILSWYYPDPFSCISIEGTTGESRMLKYEEEYEYDEDGKLITFYAYGRVEEDNLDSPEDEMACLRGITFAYDENGNLKEREYWHNTTGRYGFSTFLSSQHSYYDDDMRILYTRSYVTHGSLDSFFIYEGDSQIPSYYFELDNMYTSWPTLYKIQDNQDDYGDEHSWTSVTLEQEQKEGFGSEEEFMTEEEWLESKGYTEEMLYYIYSYSTDNADYELTLYCEEDMMSGGGILKISSPSGRSRTDKIAFTFDRCERFLSYPVRPFSVFSRYYTSGREMTFLQGETIEEYFNNLEETYGEEYGCFWYEDEKLMCMMETHTPIWRFYIYQRNKEGRVFGSPEYMLEMRPGWGVTFYAFGV